MLVVSHRMVLLELVFNTRTMTIGVTNEFRQEVLHLLTNTWYKDRQSFAVGEMEKLIGKLSRIAQAFWGMYHLKPLLYASVAYGLQMNTFHCSTAS